MYNILKRGTAYLIDIMLVSIIATAISGTTVNPNYEKIESINAEYQEVYDYYNDAYTKIDEIYSLEDDKTEKVNLFVESYPEYKDLVDASFQDDDFTEEEKETIVNKINEEYQEKYEVYFYKLKKLSLFEEIVTFVLVILYFVVFAYIMNGETLGKKLMKFRIGSASEKKLTPLNYILRSLILYGLIVSVVDLILLYTLSKSGYLTAYYYVYWASTFIQFAIIFLACFRKDGRGLHDLIAGTKVVDISPKRETDEVEEIKEEVKEAEYKEVKKPKSRRK